MAALALSRSIAPVYVVRSCWSSRLFAIDVRKNGDVVRWPALTALGVVLLLAGPWWLVSGQDAINYLRNAGYSPSSGFTSRGFTLTPSSISQRIHDGVSCLGWVQSLVLGGALLAAVITVFLDRRRLNVTHLWMLAAWAIVEFTVLSTSSNVGTAFGLPVVVVAIVLCGAVLGQFPTLARHPLGAGGLGGSRARRTGIPVHFVDEQLVAGPTVSAPGRLRRWHKSDRRQPDHESGRGRRRSRSNDPCSRRCDPQ